jgi:hypothetical protein
LVDSIDIITGLLPEASWEPLVAILRRDGLRLECHWLEPDKEQKS